MKDKEKRIEEIAKDIPYLTLDRTVFVGATETKNVSWMLSEEDNRLIAESLTEKGYQKIPEGSVMISKEEYEEYKKVVDGKAIMVENITDLNKLVQFPIEYDSKIFDDIAEFGNYIQEQASKETTEKIITKIKQFLSHVETVVDADKYSLYPEIGYKCSEVDDFLDQLEKECGTEIKEC